MENNNDQKTVELEKKSKDLKIKFAKQASFDFLKIIGINTVVITAALISINALGEQVSPVLLGIGAGCCMTGSLLITKNVCTKKSRKIAKEIDAVNYEIECNEQEKKDELAKQMEKNYDKQNHKELDKSEVNKDFYYEDEIFDLEEQTNVQDNNKVFVKKFNN